MSAAMVGDNGPISTVLLFTIDDDLTIYFTCHENTYKAQALKQNPKMAFSIWENTKIYIQGTGVATQVMDKNIVVGISERLNQQANKLDNFWPPVLRVKNESQLIIFKLNVSWLRALDLSSIAVGSPETLYTEFTFN
jgi:general stress protein 26